MKKFTELVTRIYKENFSVILNKMIAEKIPLAFFSVAPIESAITQVEKIKGQGLNIATLVTIDTALREDSDTDFEIVQLNEFAKRYLKPEYVMVLDYLSARVAVKHIKVCKIIDLMLPQLTKRYYEAFMNHVPELYEVYSSLKDELSRKTFYGFWLGRTSAQFGELVFARGSQYFTAGFIPDKGAVVIDAGVLDGGNSLTFHEFGYKVYGFEMDRENFKVAKKLADKKGFVVENFGLGSHEHEMTYTHAPGGAPGASKLIEGGEEVAKIIPLDIYVRQKKIPRVDFIKFDVEGAEIDVLKGAATTIARWKPIMAISAYHKPDDFWVLMNMVKEIRPDYEFALRHYVSSSLDVLNSAGINFESMTSLGLDSVIKDYGECCLLAR